MAAHPAELWERLFAASDALTTGSQHASSWHEAPDSEDGAAAFPYPVYSDTVEEVQRLLYDLDVIVSFDWPAWDGAARYPRGEGLASAPVAEAVRVATVIVRGERFCDGTIAQAISDGTLDAVLGRLRRWFEAEYPARPGPSPVGVSASAASDGADLNSVTALVETLTADPLFAASQASKELFHSNMLGWYLERWPQVRGSLARAWRLPRLDPDEQVAVRREWRHLDLVVEVRGRPVLIVENKVFALPDEDQLLRYGAIAGALPGPPPLVLLSLTDPGWPTGTWAPPGGGTWAYRSYASLAAALRPAAADISRTDRFAGELLDRWMNLLDQLDRLAQAVGLPSQDVPLVLAKPVRAVLAQARLDAPVQKMRCQHLATRLREMLAKDGTAGTVRIRADLTNATGLVEGFAGDNPAFGWQLQGEDFRLAIKVGEQAAGAGPDARAAVAAQHASYFDFSQLRHLVPAAGPEHPQPGSAARFLGFAPDFAYRYVKVPGITASQAQALGEYYARKAATYADGTPGVAVGGR